MRPESNSVNASSENSSVMRSRIDLKVNGEICRLDLNPGDTLLDMLRDRLGLIGAKRGCDTGGCGCCTVLVNNRAVYSCMTYALSLNHKEVTTIEGLEINGKLDPVQEAFVNGGAIQCGYCTSGIVMNAKSLLFSKSSPTDEEIKKALSGNLCRCTGYQKIIEAVKMASQSRQSPF